MLWPSHFSEPLAIGGSWGKLMGPKATFPQITSSWTKTLLYLTSTFCDSYVQYSGVLLSNRNLIEHWLSVCLLGRSAFMQVPRREAEQKLLLPGTQRGTYLIRPCSGVLSETLVSSIVQSICICNCTVCSTLAGCNWGSTSTSTVLLSQPVRCRLGGLRRDQCARRGPVG